MLAAWVQAEQTPTEFSFQFRQFSIFSIGRDFGFGFATPYFQ
jgi:hypothetical protein